MPGSTTEQEISQELARVREKTVKKIDSLEEAQGKADSWLRIPPGPASLRRGKIPIDLLSALDTLTGVSVEYLKIEYQKEEGGRQFVLRWETPHTPIGNCLILKLGEDPSVIESINATVTIGEPEWYHYKELIDRRTEYSEEFKERSNIVSDNLTNPQYPNYQARIVSVCAISVTEHIKNRLRIVFKN